MRQSKFLGKELELNSKSSVNVVVEQNPSVTKTEKQRKMKRNSLFVMAVLVSALFVTCKKEVFHPVSFIELNQTFAVLSPNSTLTLTATIKPDIATDKTLIWKIDNENIATVIDGLVTAKADGTAIISVTTKDGNITENCTLFVTSKTIYIASNNQLWINGITQNLGGISTVNSIFVSDNNDVYVVGYGDGEQSDVTAKLWKNGVVQNLTNDENSIANSVFVSNNNDVYVTGWCQNGSVTFWKNGIAQNLDGFANSVFVSNNNDVYVAGWNRNEQNIVVAKLWKNGIAQNLSDETKVAYAHSIFVNGNDVYVVGGEMIDSYNRCVPKLWKNGVVQNLPSVSDYYYSYDSYPIFVSGNNIYVVDDRTLWINGVAHPINFYARYGSSIFVK